MKNLTLCAEWDDNKETYRLFWSCTPCVTITHCTDIITIERIAAILGLNLIPIK